jgi:histone acetyltransferase (RNA polymerase elongator complex component)
MNERIQQLEKQSYTEVMHEMGGTYMAFDKEKFAELIVRECIQAVDNVGGYNEEFHMNAIKEHFGVEE